jgi:hypothetical protein
VLADFDKREADTQCAVDTLCALPPSDCNVSRILKQLDLTYLCCQTVWRRLHGNTRPAQLAQIRGMLLTPAVEAVLAEWIKWIVVPKLHGL